MTAYYPGSGSSGVASALSIAELLPNFRKALANTQNAGGRFRILHIGDSITTGIGDGTTATVPNTKSFPTRLASMMNTYFTPAASGLFIPKSNLDNQPDTRWNYPNASWLKQSNAWGFGAAIYGPIGSAGTSLVVTPGVAVDTYDVYYYQFGGAGTITVTATGGAPVVQSCAGGSAIQKITVTAAAASAANTITVANTVADVYIVGIEPYLSTVPNQVLIGNAGVSSSSTVNWTQAGTNSPLQAITAYGAKLTTIQLGVNDAKLAFLSASQFLANLKALAAQIVALGSDVIIMTFPPSNPTGNAWQAVEPSYIKALQTLTATYPVIDIYNRFSGGNFATAFAAGFMSDDVHPNDIGYQDEANAFLSFLQSIL